MDISWWDVCWPLFCLGCGWHDVCCSTSGVSRHDVCGSWLYCSTRGWRFWIGHYHYCWLVNRQSYYLLGWLGTAAYFPLDARLDVNNHRRSTSNCGGLLPCTYKWDNGIPFTRRYPALSNGCLPLRRSSCLPSSRTIK